ncbi:uncharacterized protein LOC113217485 [Frankliniella occidentalis]|uniref:Uncharacterized protein LOC113217485 n=1 Tax=Frankliniella occidentalis TaxID=133901 RepID=A0A6J1TI52_FRAOC|nr:uncharacterized protein LOC113217485 [Frankliniella occidentalis]
MSGNTVAAMSSEQLTLAQLPDDVLLVVMQLLDIAYLFALRLVCKRLGGLALHPDAWRHRRLHDTCGCAVLRLAPCLDAAVYGRDGKKHFHNSAFMATTCAVRHLDLFPEDNDYAAIALVIRNQEALGRLRSVKLMAWPKSQGRFDVLLKTLVACSSVLESLDLFISSKPYAMGPVLYGPPRSSLKCFRCETFKDAESFFNTLLAGHAATLEEVDFSVDSRHSISADTAALLLRMPRLRKLQCLVFPGMEVLAACKMLADVSLGVSLEEGAIAGAVAFFRQANQLRVVSLDYTWLDYCDMKSLPRALASSGRSLVERLTIDNFYGELQPLFGALPRLPALRVLSFLNSCMLRPCNADKMDELLLGLTPASAPTLRLLELSQEPVVNPLFKGCIHAWLHMHSDSLKKALAANPLLHILVQNPSVCGDGDSCDDNVCDVCPLDCHPQVRGDACLRGKLGLFSHDPNKCPSPENHTIDSSHVWIHI